MGEKTPDGSAGRSGLSARSAAAAAGLRHRLQLRVIASRVDLLRISSSGLCPVQIN
jgi:hypothetical protein